MTAVYCVHETGLHEMYSVDSTCCVPLISLKAPPLSNCLCAFQAKEKTSLISRCGPILSPERRVAVSSQELLEVVRISSLQ